MFDLKGKVALVTGSTQGIGLEIARALSAHGARVFINGASSIEKCRAVCESIPNSHPVLADLTRVEDIERMYTETGDVDILVLNASIQFKRQWDAFTEEEFDLMMDCNVKSSYLLMKKYAPAMKAGGWGRIVTVGSVNQYNQHPELSIYGVTKAAQMKMVQNFAPYLAPFGVTVNNVSPGAILTPRNQAVYDDAELRSKVEAKIPIGRFGTPNEISPAILLLCSDEGSYITGADIAIDGGMGL